MTDFPSILYLKKLNGRLECSTISLATLKSFCFNNNKTYKVDKITDMKKSTHYILD